MTISESLPSDSTGCHQARHRHGHSQPPLQPTQALQGVRGPAHVAGDALAEVLDAGGHLLHHGLGDGLRQVILVRVVLKK